MSFDTGFRGTSMGSIQTVYNDQPALAMPGMLAFASDLDMCDAAHVSEANGVGSGKGVVFAALTDTVNLSLPPLSVQYPGSGSALANFAGFVVLDEGMQCDSSGNPGWGFGKMAQILRAQRAGGRIWLPVKEAIIVGSSTLNLVIVAGTTNGVAYVPGDICPAALAGTSYGTSIDLSSIGVFKTAAAAGGFAMVELNA